MENKNWRWCWFVLLHEDTSDAKYDFDHGEDNDAGDRNDDAGEDLSEDLQQGVPPVAGIGVVQEGTHCGCVHLKHWVFEGKTQIFQFN